MSRRSFKGQQIAVCSATAREPASHDAWSWSSAFYSGPDYVTEVPFMRWNHELYFDPDVENQRNFKSQCRHGAFIDGAEMFDNAVFRISRAEASGMDPGHRLTLETGYEALVRCGYTAKSLMNSRGGVYVANPDAKEWNAAPKENVGGGVCGSGGSIACGRFSFVHGLKGPCISVDVGGASSLMTVNFASASLSRTGKWEPIPFALCNGWNLQLAPSNFVQNSISGWLCPQGRVFAYDASAAGYVRGDAVVSLVLKAHTDIVDGNVVVNEGPTLGQLTGSATNQSGRRAHLTAPDASSQQDVIYEALRQAGISPLDVDACETMAEGRIIHDAAEVTATCRGYRPEGLAGNEETAPLDILSMSNSLGNQLEVQGLSQILRVLLAASFGSVQPTLHLRILNPYCDIDLCERNAQIASEPLEFRLLSVFSGISNRSVTGTNCHCIGFGQVPEHAVPNPEAPPRVRAPAPIQQQAPPPSVFVTPPRMPEVLKNFPDGGDDLRGKLRELSGGGI